LRVAPMTSRVIIRKADDRHLHLRDGAMRTRT
jgi:dihydroorotase